MHLRHHSHGTLILWIIRRLAHMDSSTAPLSDKSAIAHKLAFWAENFSAPMPKH